MNAPRAAVAATAERAALIEFALRLGDTSLVLAQRLGAWVGHAPALEEDLGLANTALDLLGQARMLLSYAAELEGAGRDEDALAFFREESAFRNVTLAEQPNGDFGDTIVRQCLIDAFQLELYERLVASSDARLAEIAAKAVKETRYHFRYSAGWLVRLGDGTPESHDRVQTSLNKLWPYTVELREADEVDETLAAAGIAPDPRALGSAIEARIASVLREATLSPPAERPYAWFGKCGRHSEYLGHLLCEMQHLYRAHPGARW